MFDVWMHMPACNYDDEAQFDDGSVTATHNSLTIARAPV